MRILAAVCLFFCLPAAAFAQQETTQSTPEALASAYRCADIADDAQRLACYDEAVGRLRQAETQGQIVAIDRAGAEELRRESFGFSLPNLARMLPGVGGNTEAVERIELTVERITNHVDGRHTFFMGDGQTWTQVEPDDVRNVRVGDTVTIRRAALGSYMLSSPRGGGAHRVRRRN